MSNILNKIFVLKIFILLLITISPIYCNEQFIDVNVQDHLGRTPLHNAAYNDRIEMVQALIKHNANLNVKDNLGKTPCDYAGSCEMQDLVCDPEKLHLFEQVYNIEQQQKKTDEVLLPFQIQSSLELLDQLLVEMLQLPEFNTNDILSIERNNIEKYWAIYNLNKLNNNKLKDLTIQIKNTQQNLLQIKDDLGRYPLHVAVQQDNYDLVKLLIKNEANVHVKDSFNKTALYQAASSISLISIQIIKLLLQAGAESNEVICQSATITSTSNQNLNIQTSAQKQERIDLLCNL